MALADSLVQALRGANINVTVNNNNHYGYGDIRSGTEITLNDNRSEARNNKQLRCACGFVGSKWDFVDGQCRACNHATLKADSQRRFAERQRAVMIDGETGQIIDGFDASSSLYSWQTRHPHEPVCAPCDEVTRWQAVDDLTEYRLHGR